MNRIPDNRDHWLGPFNILATLILLFGGTIVVYRFTQGLGAVTNLTHSTPWGLWTGFKLVFVALAASGYTLATAVYLFKMDQYHVLIRPAVLCGFVGYTLFILILLFDLGRAWRIYFPFLVQAGTTSALFEIALCVALYYTTQFLELTPVGLEWMGWRRPRKIMIGLTVGLAVFGLLLSTLHQSTLGALYLSVPLKLHHLWYSPYLPLHFFLSSILAGISMVIFLGIVSKKIFSNRMEISSEKLDELTIGLGKGGAIACGTYFLCKLVDLAINNTWHDLTTRMGLWYLVELLGFVLLPCLMYSAGYRDKKPRLIRATSVIAILGVILNRLNISIFAFNWQLPAEQRYTPKWMEYVVVLSLITGGVVVYRWAVKHMPVLNQHPKFKGLNHE